MSVALPITIRHYHKTPRSSTMLVRRLWHKLATLAVSNAPTVRSRTFPKVGTGNTSANALSPPGRSWAELNWTEVLLSIEHRKSPVLSRVVMQQVMSSYSRKSRKVWFSSNVARPVILPTCRVFGQNATVFHFLQDCQNQNQKWFNEDAANMHPHSTVWTERKYVTE